MPDSLTKSQRSYCMSRVRNRDTDLEVAIRSRLHALGFRFRKNDARFPGSPDILFVKQRVAVFIDGDFWHGYRFPLWRHRLSEFWQKKIDTNRLRDRRKMRRLRSMGFRVIRIWQHEIEADLVGTIDRLVTAIRVASQSAQHIPKSSVQQACNGQQLYRKSARSPKRAL